MASRVQYGKTPWGAWFLRMLESYNDEGRLLRGKTYANTGKVAELRIDGVTVTAKVAGSYKPWYKVSLVFPELDGTDKKRIQDFIAEDPLIQAQLASGIFPERLIEKITQEHIPIIPAHFNRLFRSCTCPDYGDPCKHQAAVLYVLAQELDQDPQLLCTLAGISLNMQKQTAEIPKALAVPVLAPPCFPMEITATGEEGSGGKDTQENFSQYNYINFIIQMLPKQPTFTQDSFITSLAQFYHEAAGKYDSFISQETCPQDIPHRIANALYVLEFSALCPNDKFPLANGMRPVVSMRYQGETTQYTLLTLSRLFSSFSSPQGSKSYCALSIIYKTGWIILNKAAFVPTPYIWNGQLRIFWKPFTASKEIESILEKAVQDIDWMDMPSSLFAQYDSASKWNTRYCVELLLIAFISEFVYALCFTSKETHSALFFKDIYADIEKPGNRSLPQALANWLSVLQFGKGQYQYRIVVTQDKKTDEVSLSVQVRDERLEEDVAFVPLCEALSMVSASQTAALLLRFPMALAAYIKEIGSLSVKEDIILTEDEIIVFLEETTVLLKSFAVDVIIPKAMQRILTPKLVLTVDVNGKEAAKSASVVSWLSLDDMLQYDRAIMIGDMKISIGEFEKLVNQKKSLVRFRNQYILLDAYEVEQLLHKARKAEKINRLEVIQARLTSEAVFSPEAEKIAEQLFSKQDIPIPLNLNAHLRSYQERGFRWLYSTLNSGFGCLLADDMGLGKTIQVITLLLQLKNDSSLTHGALIIAPASLLTNWQREAEKFAPSLQVHIYHGARRKISKTADITLSTYHTIQRDAEKLEKQHFDILVLDEAQAIKNAATKSSQAVRALKAVRCIALTGTPVENRLEDLRALFDVIIPGYLGTAEEFKTRWRVPIELHADKKAAQRFQKITAPFLLRRMKTDKKIIDDLPEKIITNQYASLSKEQAALYESMIESLLEPVLKTDDPIKRSGMLFKLLTTLKQICNHPRSYDKISRPEKKLSGKCEILIPLLSDILACNEKVIIFSQYVETISVLETIIQEELHEQPLVLTGKTAVKKRDNAVDAFQNELSQSIFLISLKAGGTGLNLTAASHVIHFDLWYNPAVEDQATDRAFRIGQKRNVCVHRFICAGTFEEKIDMMIQQKRSIADMSIAGGETWISKLSNDELKTLFS